jgi:hypothetical protein
VSGVVGITFVEVTEEIRPGSEPIFVSTPVKLSGTPGVPPYEPIWNVNESPALCTAPPVEID